ncbi:MAG: hypothetical protein EON54_16370 [Alcaligenaceae bacterium]|nr:MAG: hypothetical protein EON54_16370 [Alcaligenaceae bacterium]
MDNNELQAEAFILLVSLDSTTASDAVDSFVNELRQGFSPEELHVDMTDDLEIGTPMTILSVLQSKMPEIFGLDALEKLIADGRKIDEMSRRAFERAQATVETERDSQ